MESDKQSNTYEKKWHPSIEQVLSENTSKFFRDYLQYKTASSLKVVSDNNTKELYHRHTGLSHSKNQEILGNF